MHEGLVVELLPGGMFRVKLEDGSGHEISVTAHVAEEFRRVSAPVKVGDRVKVKLSERDPKRGTIVGNSSVRNEGQGQ